MWVSGHFSTERSVTVNGFLLLCWFWLFLAEYCYVIINIVITNELIMVILSWKLCRGTVHGLWCITTDSTRSRVGSVVDRVRLMECLHFLSEGDGAAWRLMANCSTAAEQRRSARSPKVDHRMGRTVRVVDATEWRWRRPLMSAADDVGKVV